MKKKVNIPVFIPHVGCKNACVFCNQRAISGRRGFDFASVHKELDEAFATVGKDVSAQIAYFGGSFTGIDRNDMIDLLALAGEYIDAGRCESVRISTRPDYIDEEILEILRTYRVRTVELGIQSTDDAVLQAAHRGHTSKDSVRAAALLKRYGFELIGQMMVGLPLGTIENERQTALDIVDMGADGARIYPAVVFEETELATMMRDGRYTPLSTEESALRAANALSVFSERDVPVIRIGLQSSEALVSGDGVLAGGYHPAVGEMAYALYFRELTEKALRMVDAKNKTVTVYVNPSDVSKMIGQRGANREFLIKRYGLTGFRVKPDGKILKNQLKIEI